MSLHFRPSMIISLLFHLRSSNTHGGRGKTFVKGGGCEPHRLASQEVVSVTLEDRNSSSQEVIDSLVLKTLGRRLA